jgi:hypothetical protein
MFNIENKSETFEQKQQIHFNTNLFALVDSGGTCGFQSNEEHIIPGTVCKLEPPVRIKMGTCTSQAHKMGIRIFCQPSTKDKETLQCFAHLMLIVENFDSKLTILSVPRLKLQHMQLHDPPLKFSPYVYSNSPDLKYVPQDHNDLEINMYMLLTRSKNGLMFLPYWNYEEKSKYVDMTTGVLFNTAEAISKITQTSPRHLATRLNSNFTSYALTNELSGISATIGHFSNIVESLFYVNTSDKELKDFENTYYVFIKEAAGKCMGNKSLNNLIGKMLEEIDTQQCNITDITSSIRVSKRKSAQTPSQTSWPKLVLPNTTGYAKRRVCAEKYHKIFHHDVFNMELTIAAVPGILGCIPGDSRYLPGNCVACDSNQRASGRHNHNKNFHQYELDAPLTNVSMDIQYVQVDKPYKGFSYLYHFVCTSSNLHTVFPAKRLHIQDLLAALMYMTTLAKIKFQAQIRRFLADCFSTFKQQHELVEFKKKNEIIMELFPPYRHHWNISENAIGVLKRDIRKRLVGLIGKTIGGKQILPETWFIFAALHAEKCRNLTGSRSLQRRFNIYTTPLSYASQGKLKETLPHAFAAEAYVINRNQHRKHLSHLER